MTSSTVSTGRYRYLLDGTEIGVDERFSIEHSVGNTVVRSSRLAPGTSLTVEATYMADGSASCSLRWTSELEGTAPVLNADYDVAVDGSVSARWNAGDGTPVHERSIPADSRGLSFFPLMRVFSGRSLAKLVAVTPTPLPVVVPDIRDPRAVDAFLTPLLGDRFAASVEEGGCMVDGVVRACAVVDYRGGSYDSDATVYVDDGGLLLRYTWPQEGAGDWDVQLCEVEGAWPAPSQW